MMYTQNDINLAEKKKIAFCVVPAITQHNFSSISLKEIVITKQQALAITAQRDVARDVHHVFKMKKNIKYTDQCTQARHFQVHFLIRYQNT
jgi:hypothetical protein